MSTSALHAPSACCRTPLSWSDNRAAAQAAGSYQAASRQPPGCQPPAAPCRKALERARLTDRSEQKLRRQPRPGRTGSGLRLRDHGLLHLEFMWTLTVHFARGLTRKPPKRQRPRGRRTRFGMTLYRRGVIAWDRSSCSSFYRSWSRRRRFELRRSVLPALRQRAVDIVIPASRQLCAFCQALSVLNRSPKAYWQAHAPSADHARQAAIVPSPSKLAVNRFWPRSGRNA